MRLIDISVLAALSVTAPGRNKNTAYNRKGGGIMVVTYYRVDADIFDTRVFKDINEVTEWYTRQMQIEKIEIREARPVQ